MSILGDIIELSKDVYKLWNSWKDKKPTDAEKEILIEALKNNGEFAILSTGQTGEWVRVGKVDYIDDKDPAVRAGALESLEKLYLRGLVRHEGGSLFCLTGSGFDIARKLNS
jgi:hypothetical protein